MDAIKTNAEMLFTALLHGDIRSLPALVDELADEELFSLYQKATVRLAAIWQINQMIERILHLLGLNPAIEFKPWKFRIIRLIRYQANLEEARAEFDRSSGVLRAANIALDGAMFTRVKP